MHATVKTLRLFFLTIFNEMCFVNLCEFLDITEFGCKWRGHDTLSHKEHWTVKLYI